jgi:hypothetical protein
MTDTELRERVARIANEICGCATPEQRRRDIALIEAEIDRRVAEEKAKLLERFDEDELEQIISNSLDMDWLPRDAARAIRQAMLAQFEKENSDA